MKQLNAVALCKAPIMSRMILAAVLLSVACDLSTEPKPGSTLRLPALVDYNGNPAVFDVPASATRGTSFTVTFTTYGGGCIERAENEISVAGLDVKIRSYQRVYFPREGENCTDELRIESNVVNLTLAGTGTARVRVFGRKMPGNLSVVMERLVPIVP